MDILNIEETSNHIDPHRPEILVFGFVEFVETQARIGRIQLQVKSRGFHDLLFLASEFGLAVGEGIGDAEVHGI